QLDTRPIRIAGDREISDQMVAGYLAKYATKSTEASGHISRRLTRETIDLYADPNGSHTERLIHACWRLGGYVPRPRLRPRPPPPPGRPRRWPPCPASAPPSPPNPRRYSITFRLLRESRVIWRRTVDELGDDTALLVANLVYAGSGWRSLGDALL